MDNETEKKVIDYLEMTNNPLWTMTDYTVEKAVKTYGRVSGTQPREVIIVEWEGEQDGEGEAPKIITRHNLKKILRQLRNVK